MEFRRLHAALTRISERRASALMETLVAFALIGITALFTASGIIVALGIYNSANEIRDESARAVSALYEASQTGSPDGLELLDYDAPQVGEVTHTGEFAPDDDGAVIDVYSYCVIRSSMFEKNTGVVYYYYEAESD